MSGPGKGGEGSERTPPPSTRMHGSTEVGPAGPTSLSYSQLSTFGQCPRKYQLSYLDPVARDAQLELGSGLAGSAVHSVIELSETNGWYSHDRDTALSWMEMEFLKLFSKAVREAIDRVGEDGIYWGGKASREWPDGEVYEWWLKNQRAFFTKYLRIRDNDSKEGLRILINEDGKLPWVERRVGVHIDVDGTPRLITGMVDVVMYANADGEAVIRDWKTGRRQPDPFQLGVYAWLINRVSEGKVQVNVGEMAWLRGASMETLLKRHDISVWLPVIEDQFRGLALDIEDRHRTGRWTPNKNDLCSWCTVRLFCPIGVALESAKHDE